MPLRTRRGFGRPPAARTTPIACAGRGVRRYFRAQAISNKVSAMAMEVAHSNAFRPRVFPILTEDGANPQPPLVSAFPPTPTPGAAAPASDARLGAVQN